MTPFTNPRGSHGFRLRSCSVTGVGACLPERVLTNAELEKKLVCASGKRFVISARGSNLVLIAPKLTQLPQGLRGGGFAFGNQGNAFSGCG